MPELPEVETVVRALAPHVTGRRIAGVEVFERRSVAGSPLRLPAAVGRNIEAVRRRGKFILLDLSGDLGLAIHLRMTGWLGLALPAAAARKRDPHLRVSFTLAAGCGRPEEQLLFRDIRIFGRVWCGTRGALARLRELQRLGPDALDISAEDFAARLRARRGRLKSLLLNQTFLAGLGNIYADEALHAARLHPLRNAQGVSVRAARRLHAEMRAVLERSLARGGTTIQDYFHPDGGSGWFQRELKVYQREGEPCGACGARIRRVVVGQRGTWFCPHCQKPR